MMDAIIENKDASPPTIVKPKMIQRIRVVNKFQTKLKVELKKSSIDVDNFLSGGAVNIQ